MRELNYTKPVSYTHLDMEALTTTLDLKEVVYRLLEYSWFREIVSQNTYTATLPDGSTQIWQNTCLLYTSGNPLTRAGATYILCKYVQMAGLHIRKILRRFEN